MLKCLSQEHLNKDPSCVYVYFSSPRRLLSTCPTPSFGTYEGDKGWRWRCNPPPRQQPAIRSRLTNIFFENLITSLRIVNIYTWSYSYSISPQLGKILNVIISTTFERGSGLCVCLFLKRPNIPFQVTPHPPRVHKERIRVGAGAVTPRRPK